MLNSTNTSPADESNKITKINMINEKFNEILDFWIEEIERYDYRQLCLQPETGSWSIGQVYCHLIEETYFFFQEIDHCLNKKENLSEEMADKAKIIFKNNAFPNEKLKGPAEIQSPPLPSSKAQLREDLKKLKAAVDQKGKEISEQENSGKTKHPGHNYLNATEWFQYAEMHFRHHSRQKERLDIFLKASQNM